MAQSYGSLRTNAGLYGAGNDAETIAFNQRLIEQDKQANPWKYDGSSYQRQAQEIARGNQFVMDLNTQPGGDASFGGAVSNQGLGRFSSGQQTPQQLMADSGTWYADPASAQWSNTQVRPREGGQSGVRAGADDPSLRLPVNTGVRQQPWTPQLGDANAIGPQPMRPSGVNVPGFEHTWRPGPNGTEGQFASGTNTMNFQNGGFAPSGSGVTGGTFLHQNNNRAQGASMPQQPAMYSPEWNAAYMQGGAGHQTTPPVAARQIPNSVPNRPWFPTDLTTANILSGNIPQGQTAASQNQSSVPQGQPLYGRQAPAYSGYNLVQYDPSPRSESYYPEGERGGNGEWVSPQQGNQMNPYADSFYDPNGMYGGNRPQQGQGAQPTGYAGYNMTGAPPPRPTYGNATGGSGMWNSGSSGQGYGNYVGPPQSGSSGSSGSGYPGMIGPPLQGPGPASGSGTSVGIGTQNGVTPTVTQSGQGNIPGMVGPPVSGNALTRGETSRQPGWQFQFMQNGTLPAGYAMSRPRPGSFNSPSPITGAQRPGLSIAPQGNTPFTPRQGPIPSYTHGLRDLSQPTTPRPAGPSYYNPPRPQQQTNQSSYTTTQQLPTQTYVTSSQQQYRY